MFPEETNKEKFSRLAIELNELMRSDIISDCDEKPIPYLGWFWRDITPEIPRLVLSKADDMWWIDEAGKWNYEHRFVEGEEAIEILTKSIEAVKASQALLEKLAG